MPHGKHASGGRAQALRVRATGAGTPPHCRILQRCDTTMDGGAACSQARTLVHAPGARTRRQLSIPHAWYATIPHNACITPRTSRDHPPTRWR
jgi:hypothetical protein